MNVRIMRVRIETGRERGKTFCSRLDGLTFSPSNDGVRAPVRRVPPKVFKPSFADDPDDYLTCTVYIIGTKPFAVKFRSARAYYFCWGLLHSLKGLRIPSKTSFVEENKIKKKKNASRETRGTHFYYNISSVFGTFI